MLGSRLIKSTIRVLFFAAARIIAVNAKVKCVDLVEFDPSKDLNDIGALTAGRWLAEILAGFAARG